MTNFKNIYPFTTENVSGYMNGMNIEGKKVITVTGSSDHIINCLLNGSKDITTFDINPLTKYYMELKLAGIQVLTFEEFLKVFLYRTNESFNPRIILNLPISKECHDFFEQELEHCGNSGLNLRDSSLFHISYFSPETIISQNPYLTKRNYKIVKKRLKEAKIKFIKTDIKDLELQEDYDYMFLSNIADYLDEIYKDDILGFKNTIEKFLLRVKQIYIAYLYDLGNNNRSKIYDLETVKQVFPGIKLETFRSIYSKNKDAKRDGVLILRRKD